MEEGEKESKNIKYTVGSVSLSSISNRNEKKKKEKKNMRVLPEYTDKK